jgi:predicted dehydrogenase
LVGQAVHIPTLRRLSGFDLVAVADPSRKVCRELGGRYPEVRMHTDWRQLLEAHALDAVVICSPNATHAEIALAALDAGLHVLVEKPLAITVEDVDAIARAAADRERVVQVGYMKRFDAAYERLAESLPPTADGLRFIDVVTYDPWMARPPFAPADLIVADDVSDSDRAALAEHERTQVEAALGAADLRTARTYSNIYLGALIHDVNLVHGLIELLGLTAPARAVASSQWADGKAAQAVFELETSARWHCAWLLLEGAGVFRETVTLYFEDRVDTLEFDAPYFRDHPTQLSMSTGAGPGAQQSSRYARIRDSFLAEIEHFYACITAGVPCRTPPEQARADLVALRDAFLIVRGGHEIPVPARAR